MRSESTRGGTSAVQGVAGYIVRVAERSLHSASDRSATLRGIAAEGGERQSRQPRRWVNKQVPTCYIGRWTPLRRSSFNGLKTSSEADLSSLRFLPELIPLMRPWL